MKNFKCELVMRVAKAVDDWVWKEFIPSFDSKEEMANDSLRVAAVMNMNDCIQNVLKEAAYQVLNCGEDETELTSYFDILSIEDFYYFFMKQHFTLSDVYNEWIEVEEPLGDLLGLAGSGCQVEAIFEEIKYILDIEEEN